MYNVTGNYLLHDGGTKFYETIRIEADNGPAMLIKRWGKASEFMNGGGQTKIHRGSASVVRAEEIKILEEKRKMRPGKGQYISRNAGGYGLHDMVNKFTDGEVEARLSHYSDPDVRSSIATYFNLDANNAAPVEQDIETEVEIEEPTPVERGDNWASW